MKGNETSLIESKATFEKGVCSIVIKVRHRKKCLVGHRLVVEGDNSDNALLIIKLTLPQVWPSYQMSARMILQIISPFVSAALTSEGTYHQSM